AIPFHRVIAQLEGRNVRLPVGATDHFVDGLLHRQRARLNELSPVVEREKILERLLRLLAYRDEIDELPVVLRGKPDPLVMRDSPHRRRIDGATKMDVEFSQLIAKGMRH